MTGAQNCEKLAVALLESRRSVSLKDDCFFGCLDFIDRVIDVSNKRHLSNFGEALKDQARRRLLDMCGKADVLVSSVRISAPGLRSTLVTLGLRAGILPEDVHRVPGVASAVPTPIEAATAVGQTVQLSSAAARLDLPYAYVGAYSLFLEELQAVAATEWRNSQRLESVGNELRQVLVTSSEQRFKVLTLEFDECLCPHPMSYREWGGLQGQQVVHDKLVSIPLQRRPAAAIELLRWHQALQPSRDATDVLPPLLRLLGSIYG